MKTPACLLALISAVALGLVATLSGPARAADMGVPGTTNTPNTPSDNADLQGRYRTPAQPQNAAPNENYRANYFTDYHTNQGAAGTQGVDEGQQSAANIRDSIGRRDIETSTRDPFERELSRFRGEMSVWRRR